MSQQNNLFYRKNQATNFNFSAEAISSDGGIFLLEKIERKFGIVKNFASNLPDNRNQSYTKHNIEQLLKQRVFLLIQGYEDCNDEKYLRNDPVISSALDHELASQPSLSRFENSLSFRDIYRLSEKYIENYVNSINPNRKQIIIDADGTDDPTHGKQQYSMFNGYYKQMMYNELLFHDGETGQVILPVLRPGNSHSNRWFTHILKIIVNKIREKHPKIEIIIRADGGFSNANFYKLMDEENLKYCVGLTRNQRIKEFTTDLELEIENNYVEKKEKYQEFIGPFSYKAKSWEKAQNCYAKVESTGKGLNVRYFSSNIEGLKAQDLYWDFYVKRGDSSENRIKELKNMCFSGRLSCHKFTANYLRLFISTLAYELMLKIRELIKQVTKGSESRWQMSNIRLYLLKVGATIKKRVRSITICFSKSYVCQDLFKKIVMLC